jgi:hypothetical protein
MTDLFNRFLDWFSNYFAHRKGLLPIAGIVLVVLNLILRLAVPGWLADSDLLLHLGVILAIFGILLAWAL